MMQLVVIGLTVGILSGYSAAQEGWPVEQRCVGEPTAPPEGWTFEGTILMTGYAGIHAVQADWETPRVVVFLGRHDVWGGALSPDGRWYASPYGVTYTTDTFNTITEVEELRVYSTQDTDQDYRISIPYSFFSQETYAQLYWLDNDQVIYEDWNHPIQINPFTSETSPWEGASPSFSGYDGLRPVPSPDWMRSIFINGIERGNRTWALYDVSSQERLANLPLRKYSSIAWMPNSSQFVAETLEYNATDNDRIHKLTLFSRDGSLIDTIFELPAGQQVGPVNLKWSLDGRYLAFITYEDGGFLTVESNWYEPFRDHLADNTLYVADVQERKIVNMCVAVGRGLAWSPNSSYVAFLHPGEGTLPLMVLDVQTEELYVVARHLVNRYQEASVIGWRSNE